MLKYKAIIADKKDFDAKIITPMKTAVKEGDQITWLNDADKFYSIDMLSYILKNAYNERYVRYDTEDEFIGYFSNIFLTVTPMFFSKISNIIEDKLKELQDNTKVGIKTNIQSKSNRGESGRAFDNTVGDGKQTSTETSDYTMDSRSDNLLDNAKKLSQARISGEVTLYVASFAELFTTLDIEEDMDKSFTPALIAILSDIALAVTKLGHVEVGDGAGGSVDLIDFTGRLMTEASVDTAIATQIKDYDTKLQQQLKDSNDELLVDIIRPLSNRISAIGANQIVQEDGSEIGFDDDTPQKVYSKEALEKYRSIKDITNLTTQDDVYNNVEVNKRYIITIAGQLYDIICKSKTAINASLFGSTFTSAGQSKTVYSLQTKGTKTPPIVNALLAFNVGTPTLPSHAVPKNYVDDGRYKPDIKYYSTETLETHKIEIYNTLRSGRNVIAAVPISGLESEYGNVALKYNRGTSSATFYVNGKAVSSTAQCEIWITNA